MTPCLLCVRKHLASAMCYLTESKLGYPDHIWRVIGQLSLAEDECVNKLPKLAIDIRVIRRELMEIACDSNNHTDDGKMKNINGLGTMGIMELIWQIAKEDKNI